MSRSAVPPTSPSRCRHQSRSRLVSNRMPIPSNAGHKCRPASPTRPDRLPHAIFWVETYRSIAPNSTAVLRFSTRRPTPTTLVGQRFSPENHAERSTDQPHSDNRDLFEMQRHRSQLDRDRTSILSPFQTQSFRLHFPTNRHRDLSHVLHQFLELAGLDRLFAVTQRTFWVRMDFDENAIRPRRHRRFRHRRH